MRPHAWMKGGMIWPIAAGGQTKPLLMKRGVHDGGMQVLKKEVRVTHTHIYIYYYILICAPCNMCMTRLDINTIIEAGGQRKECILRVPLVSPNV